ncbi:regulator of G-protein signaling 9-binding protein-like [Pollicipes pollicipes]|uniref:regulator of G-protein signaling 9-binding protein-like n=1 Tax=Pollicipes pollicipes TaxID=41117 RepID=UPI001884D2F3|nr:regulator of G-protein signaling 9-binding protein-like [Pollicipes pollicipes]
MTPVPRSAAVGPLPRPGSGPTAHVHTYSRGKSLSRRGKHPAGPEFSNRHQTNKMVKELSHVISCFRHLAVGLGSAGDGRQLRSDLTCLRLLISHLVKVIRVTLEAHTRKWVLYKESDRRELVRISNIFYSCVTIFTQDMRRSLELHTIFVIGGTAHAGFINTGVSGYHSFMLSEREFGEQSEDADDVNNVQIQNTIKDMDIIREEIKNLPWYTVTWSPEQANNLSGHDAVSIEEDQVLLFPGAAGSPWFLMFLIASIFLVVASVLTYTLVLFLH